MAPGISERERSPVFNLYGKEFIISLTIFTKKDQPLIFGFLFSDWKDVVLIYRSLVAVVQSLSCVRLFVTPWTAAFQASMFFIFSWTLLRFMSTESGMPSNYLILVAPFSSCPQSFPASGSFPMSWLFASGGRSVGASASVLAVNIQGWFPLGWTSLISFAVQGTPESL